MKLQYSSWALIIRLLEGVVSDPKASPAEKLEAIEVLKILKYERIG